MWQRFICRLALHGPVTPEVPASILQLYDTEVVLSGAVADNCSSATCERASTSGFLRRHASPEISHRFLPFVCVDPGRMIGKQIEFLEELLSRYRVYGIKVNPVACQSKVIDLLKAPRLFEFAAKHNLPFLFHVSSIEHETFSYTGDALRVVEEYPGNRFCLAHCLLFHKGFLDRADRLSHVWVDTAALKIQCRMVAEQWPVIRRCGKP